MDTNPIAVRRAQTGDEKRLARLHVSVWRATYQDYAPPEAIAKLDETRRLPYWIDAVNSAHTPSGALVAEFENEILGVVSFGPSTHAAFGGRTEIKHLYVDLGAHGQGIGQRLLRAVVNDQDIHEDGGVALAVVEQNGKARAFYQRMGGVEIGKFVDPGPLWKSNNIVVAWD